MSRALRAHVPELADVRVAEVAQGLDHSVFAVGDLAVRLGEGRDLLREAHLLDVVAPRLPVQIPTPRFVDERAGVLAYPLLPGRPLLGRRAPAGSARRLGRFLRELHGIDTALVRDLAPTEEADPARWIPDLDEPSHLLRLLHETVPPPAGRHVLAHADLGAEHILESDGQITGVIDWSDAAITDPALDFARLYRDFGPPFLLETLDAYGGLEDADAAMTRIEFFARCAALEDLAYGRTTGRSAYSHAAQRSLTWLFPGA